MSFTLPNGAQPLDYSAPSREIGLTSTQGGLVIVGTPFSVPGAPSNQTQVSHHLHIQNGGNVLCQMPDGTINPYLGVLNGSYIITKAVKVVASAVLNDSMTYNTTATGITWHGGQ